MANLLAKFFGRTASEGAAFALGLATGPVLHPAVRELEYEANGIYPTLRLDPDEAAGIVAEDVELRDWGANEAAAHGLSGDRFDALLGEALNAPGVPSLLELWRRGLVDDATLEHGLRKAKLEPRWDGPLRGLHDVLLSPDTLANARQQGFVDVARQHSESEAQGVTNDRADVLFELSGNPPGPVTMQDAVNRGLTDEATFRQAIREGRTKTKYTDLLWQLRANVLSAATYVAAHLKGHITEAEMHAGGAKHGYSAADMDLWFQSAGRPASVHQIHVGYARGAKLPGAANEEDAVRRSVAQSDIRPEYADLLYAGRYTYPSAFVLRGLVQSGALTEQEGEQALLFSGWEPTFAAKVASSWASGGAAPATDPHTEKARTQLWGTTHRSFIAAESSDAVARTALLAAGVAQGAIAGVLDLWKAERELIRKQLTPAQVKKAYSKATKNYATGQPWTRDDALAALVARGYSVTDANDYLDLPASR